jgi:hypothetical protein
MSAIRWTMLRLTMIRHRGELLVLGTNCATKLLLEKTAKEAAARESKATRAGRSPLLRNPARRCPGMGTLCGEAVSGGDLSTARN